MPRSTARAKVNLTLNVGAVVTDPASPIYAYHPLSSLVVFADFGDNLEINPAAETTLKVAGPFAKDVPQGPGNLILRALAAVKTYAALPEFDIRLTKNLPAASGLGGGSADAAAMLRLLSSYAELPPKTIFNIARALGADVPVCLTSQTCEMTGIGEAIRPLPGLGQVAALLVNPGAPVSTGAVFAAYDKMHPLAAITSEDLTGSLMDMATSGKNDLEPAAISIAPVIANVLKALRAESGCRAARMSGSGATCFGIFDNLDIASRAEKALAKRAPGWWSRAVMLGDTDAV